MKKQERKLSDGLAAPGANQQALRLQRHRMAAATSLLVIGIVLATYLAGALTAAPALIGAVAIFSLVLLFYGLFRSGLNQRFSDPSLTLPQMLAASVVVLGLMYFTDSGRSLFLLLLLMVFMFGVLRFDTRTLLRYAVGLLVAYAALVGLLWIKRPQDVDAAREGVQWLTLACALPWFAWMGGYIRGLRLELGRRNAELTQALQAARASESNLAEAQQIAKIGMWVVDPTSRSTTWSRETFRLFEIDPAKGAPSGRELRELIHPDDVQIYNNLIQPALREGRNFDSEFRLLLSSGRIRWLHALGRPVVDENGRTTVVKGTLRDITEQREADAHIRHLAHFDGLTGLPNRSLFTQLLTRAVAQAERRDTPVAVLFIDLDGFKGINDRLGHNAGDSLLLAFASRLIASLRRSDGTGRVQAGDRAARLGGDEFVVLIDDFLERAQLEVVASRILSVVATPFQLEGGAGDASFASVATIGASIGIALYPQDCSSAESLLRRADEAMYAAKQAGKNTYRFYEASGA